MFLFSRNDPPPEKNFEVQNFLGASFPWRILWSVQRIVANGCICRFKEVQISY